MNATDDVEAPGKRRFFLFSRRLSIVGSVCGLFVCYIVHDALQERAFRRPGFTFGWCMTAVEIFTMFMSAWLSGAGASQSTKSHKRLLSKEVFFLITAIAVSQGTGSSALAYVRYPVKVAAKSSKLVPTLIFSAILTGKRYKLIDYAAALLLCFGLAALGLAEENTQDEGQNHKTGFILLIVAVCSDAIIPNLQENLLRQIPSTTMVFLSNLGSFCLVFLFVLFNGELSAFLKYLRTDRFMILWLSAQALSAYFGLRCYLSVIRQLGGVAGVLATSARKVFTLILSFLLFDKPFTTGHAKAFAFLSLGVALNLSTKIFKKTNKQGQERPTKKILPDDTTNFNRTKNEATTRAQVFP